MKVTVQFLMLLSPLHFFCIPVGGPCHRRQQSTESCSVGPSHGLQFSKNCSSMCPLHRACSIRNRQIHGLPTASHVLSENLLCYSPFLPRTQILTGTSSTKEIPQGHSFFRGTYTCSGTGSFTARERISAQWISIDFMGPTCFTMLFFTGCSISDWLSFHSDRSIWELIGTGSVRPGLGCLLTKAIPAAHLTIETLPCKSNAAGICLLNH